MDAVELFLSNWFLRNLHRPDLTLVEEQFVRAAMGPEPAPLGGGAGPGADARVVGHASRRARTHRRPASVRAGGDARRGAGRAHPDRA